MTPLLECVPNFSEGQDPAIIAEIAGAIRAAEGVQLLEIDPGHSANRTVMTFVGEPRAVIEAAFQAIKTAAEYIDMSKHKGVHPRMGATDVCPLIPIRGVDSEEALEYAEDLARRVGEKLKIPVYLYEKSAKAEHRKNLADIRKGEYEGFRSKIYHPDWRPDYGPTEFNESAGQTVIGVRDFLIAYNINLNTRDPQKAEKIARLVRESGYIKTENGVRLTDPWGTPLRVKGKFTGLKAIGWYIEEYDLAQVSMNITNLKASPLHEVFEEVDAQARKFGLRVTGSELVGLLPQQALMDAGRFYLKLMGESPGQDEKEVMDLAVKSLGLDALTPFQPEKKVLEFAMAEKAHYTPPTRFSMREWLLAYEYGKNTDAYILAIRMWHFLSKLSRAIGFLNQVYKQTHLEGDQEQWGLTSIELQEIKESLILALDALYPYLCYKGKNPVGLHQDESLYQSLLRPLEACWNIVKSWHDEDVLRGPDIEEDYYKNIGWGIMELLKTIQQLFLNEKFTNQKKIKDILENIELVTVYQNL